MKYCCDNCDFETGDSSELLEFRDFWSRAVPGSTIPAGDCPECGAFVYPEDEDLLQVSKVITQAESALGENLVWLTDKLDLEVRQRNADTLRRLKQLNDAWVSLAKLQALLKNGE